MLLFIRRVFARIVATILSVVTLRLLQVNRTGKPSITDQDRDGTHTSHVD